MVAKSLRLYLNTIDKNGQKIGEWAEDMGNGQALCKICKEGKRASPADPRDPGFQTGISGVRAGFFSHVNTSARLLPGWCRAGM